MANKRPPIEMGELTENLKQSSGKGMSAFFPASSSPTSQDEIIPETPAPPSQPAENEVPSVVDDVTTSSRYDVSFRKWRDIIEDTETHNSALRLTNDESYAIEDVINDLKRKYKVKTSMNELARLGLLYLVQDFKKNKQQSLIVEVKKS